MASEECVKLLLSAGDFARLSATEQRTKLVIYYQSWFLSDYRIDTVNNIRASQRLTTHAKLMAAPVGIVLQAILLEASGIEPRAHGLLGVEVDQADTSQEDDEAVPGTSQGLPPEPPSEYHESEQVTAVTPTPASDRPQRRAGRVK